MMTPLPAPTLPAPTLPAPTFSQRLRATRPGVAGALALGVGLMLSFLPRATFSSETAPADFWTLTVMDEQGLPLPGAVLLGAEAPASNSQQSRPDSDAAGMSPLIIDQRNKRFEPFVSVSAPQRPVSFPNSDDTRHHVYSFSESNVFERKLYRANDADPVIFTSEGVVALGCNIHDNMQAYILVTSEPAAGPSDSEGLLRVMGSAPPASKATLQLWHPLLNTTGEGVAVPVTRSNRGAAVTLPLTWSDPQAPRSQGDLESLLRQFSREDP